MRVDSWIFWFYRSFIFYVLLFFLETGVAQQNAIKLKEQQQKTLQEIQMANKLLEEMKGRSKSSLLEISLIDIKVKARQQSVKNLELEVAMIDAALEENLLLLHRTEREIDEIKRIYGKLILSLYRSGDRHKLAVLFLASENMNQLYKRIRYTQMMMDYLRTQKQRLDEAVAIQRLKVAELTRLHKEKVSVARKRSNEVSHLKRELSEQTLAHKLIEKKLNQIKEEIAAKERTAIKLKEEINKIVERDRGASAKERTAYRMTPEEKTLSGDFEKNRGSLPWPLQKGLIVGQYGEHNHPEYKSVVIRNDGIYISTQPGEKVRSVFKGIVSRVFSIPGENYTVIVKHGGYYTLYHNLIDVKVKPGQNVAIKEELGVVFTDRESKETSLYFQIWNGTNKDNPMAWLAH